MSEMYGGQVPVGPTQPENRRLHGREDKPKAKWFVGVLLIALGVIFLLENFGFVFSENWWALFIYIGAAAVFANMVREWRSAGWFDSRAAGSLTFGLVLTTVATIFILNLMWDTYWPLILVAVGAGIVIGWILGELTGDDGD